MLVKEELVAFYLIFAMSQNNYSPWPFIQENLGEPVPVPEKNIHSLTHCLSLLVLFNIFIYFRPYTTVHSIGGLSSAG